jgi:Adenine-specific methyltransferase EcoRI
VRPMSSKQAAVGTSQAKRVSLGAAKIAKKDEFYTQLSDIEREVKHYRAHFGGKVVYCNCDDPRVSNFFHYFSYNFEKLGLKKLITTCYKSQEPDLVSQNDSEQAIWLEYGGDTNGNSVPDPSEIGIKLLNGDGDFRSSETIDLLKQADVVVTNPPFSLFREYIAQLIQYDKKFLIIGNMNAVTYKEIWPLIQDDKLWLGVTRTGTGQMWFRVNDDWPVKTGQRIDEDGVRYQTVGNSAWFTNFDISKRHEDLILYKTYNPQDYPSYDNYDGIEVSQAVNIPGDYDGVMGVPITFLGKHNPDQFEIVGIAKAPLGKPSRVYPKQVQVDINGGRSLVTKLNDGPVIKVEKPPRDKTYYEVDGGYFVQLYARVLIKNKRL